MNTNDLENNVVGQALDNIGNAKALSMNLPSESPITENTAPMYEKEDTGNGSNTPTPNTANNTVSSFVGLPIESLICAPIIAAAKGQQELTAVYIDSIKKLAYATDGKTTNKLDFTVSRPITSTDGTPGSKKFSISAPLLSLVPVPAFTMDELTVDFDMEVKNSDMSQTEAKAAAESTLNYKSWYGLSANITGNVSSDSTHRRETDSSATYKIHARAIQQPPSEGMAKLTALFSQMIEPIPATSNS